MKLEAGMYVRTIGGIERLKKENDNGWFFEKSMIIKPDNIEKYIIKASHNIIDLIEKGDYVNGELVESIEVDSYKDYVINSGYWCKQKDIKSIVTKEQFESIKYSLEVGYEKKSKKCSYIR